MAAGGRHAITYTATLDAGFRGWVRNEALVASAGDAFTLTARTLVPVEVYLPLVARR